MTDQELSNLLGRLEIWRAERGIDYEMQREGLLGNVLEECTEFVRATSTYEKIDALCDIAVFVMNSQRDDFVSNLITPIIPDNSVEIVYSYLERTSKAKDTDTLFRNFTKLLLERVTTYIAGDLRWDSYNKEDYSETIQVDETILRVMLNVVAVGLKIYTTKSLYECLDETIKEIESRTGRYSTEMSKFVKDKGFYTREQLLEYLQKTYEFNGKWVIQEKDEWFICKKELDSDENEYKFKKWYKADYGVYHEYQR